MHTFEKAMSTLGPKILFSISGLLFIGGAFTLAVRIIREVSWIKVDGTIVDVESCGCDSEGCEWRAVITFASTSGEDTTFSSSACTSYEPTVGDDIPVLFDPEDPTNAIDASFLASFLVPTILLVISVVAGGVAFRNQRRVNQERREEAGDPFQTQPQTSGGLQTIADPYETQAQTSVGLQSIAGSSGAPGPSTDFRADTAAPYVQTAASSYSNAPLDNSPGDGPGGGEGEVSYFDQMMADLDSYDDRGGTK